MQTIYPAVRYRDANAAIEWLGEAFGFAEQAVYRDDEGKVAHAQLELDGQMIMLGEIDEGSWTGTSPPDPQASTITLYVVVADPDAHCERAKAAGAEITREPVDQDYGGRDYGARDLEGNAWSFGTYQPAAG